MSIKNKLQIIVITYNRAKFLDATLKQLLADNSPVKDFDITVLDNNSTDGTAAVVKAYRKEYGNLKYKKNTYNLGLGGNIARALEIADMQYVWTLADDDIIDWSAWPYLEEAVSNGEEVICAANYALSEGEQEDIPALLQQFSFVSCDIYKTSLFTDTTMTNILNNVYTLFPHLVPAIEHINKGKKIYLLPKPLVSNGMKADTDISYIRGYDNDSLYLKQRSMSWITGYANIIAQIKDKKLRYKIMARPINREIHKGWPHFYSAMYNWYWKKGNILPLLETARQIPLSKRISLFLYMISPIKLTSSEKGIYIRIFGKIKTKIWPKKR